MNRTDRLVAMVTYLQGRRIVRAEELSAHFEVSLRTVYRDVAALSEAGVPVVGEAGVGYSLVKGYHLPPVMFTAEEAMALAMGEDLVKQFTDQSLATPMATALLKIRSVLSRDHQDDLDRLGAATAIEGRCSVSGRPDQRTLLPLQQAIISRRVVRLRYRARDGQETERSVEPMGVVYYGDAWYLVSWCRLRDDYRHLKLVRIADLQVTGERFTPRANFILREHLDGGLGNMAPFRVRVWFAERVLERARRESFVRFSQEEPGNDGGRIVTFATYSIEWLARWLVSFAGDAEAIDPPELRQLVVKYAESVLEKHAAFAGS
jgi:predicted DNA-binding transcriptional regulator YafY